MKLLCLTGGIAAGKSTVSMFLEQLGANTIDADKVGHLVYEPGAQAYIKVIDAFGADIVADDNHINRRALGAKVFGKPEELKKLTDIVWPEIRNNILLEIEGYKAAYPDGVVVLDAAVLFEAGWNDIGDATWVVMVDREVAIERAMARDALDREAVENRIDAQIGNEEKRSRADVVFENNGTEAELRAEVESAYARFIA